MKMENSAYVALCGHNNFGYIEDVSGSYVLVVVFQYGHDNGSGGGESGSSCSDSSPSCSGKPIDPIDGLFAGDGYKVLSFKLWQVAQSLEIVMVNAPTKVSHLMNDAVHYNLLDVASWVDSLLSNLHQPKIVPNPSTFLDLNYIVNTQAGPFP
ncbi:hypothetical protein RJ639_020083 [Escallonia herrerae]|uniref:Transcriptional factor DELLA N-terminal domain-containing protein n=1 Tax=Escallonia herrerae TaxID=1293975 RepID=A0AA89AJG0_9ASTE|nr:hypothetical protein RJ639_020083 [Escallonia herrerae]